MFWSAIAVTLGARWFVLLIVLSGTLKFASRGARMNLRAQDVLFFVLLFACFSTRLDLSIFWTYVSLILHSGALLFVLRR